MFRAASASAVCDPRPGRARFRTGDAGTGAPAWPGRVVSADRLRRAARAHMLHAGADIAARQPLRAICGLTQLYAIRYGTIPVASRVGGLADTIVDYAPHEARDEDCATGFLFDGQHPHGIVHAVGRALAAFAQPSSWHALQRNAMSARLGLRKCRRRTISRCMRISSTASAVRGHACSQDAGPRRERQAAASARRVRRGRDKRSMRVSRRWCEARDVKLQRWKEKNAQRCLTARRADANSA